MKPAIVFLCITGCVAHFYFWKQRASFQNDCSEHNPETSGLNIVI